MSNSCIVVGGGLAGSECALTLASKGIDVCLYEMRPKIVSGAHHTDKLAELVCSNSFKSEKLSTAAGLLKWELEALGSSLLKLAHKARVQAGNALAVDRELFSALVTKAIEDNPYITLIREEVRELPKEFCVIAAGPLCSDALFSALSHILGKEALSFFDAAAPIVSADSIDTSIAFSQSRYDTNGDGDYLNCPLSKEEYERFYTELIHAKRTIMHDFEQKELFSACQPVEEVARTGFETLYHGGALKPVGLIDPRDGLMPFACVQLRAENKQKTSYNLVGFQTNLTWAEQKRVFRLIPGLEHAEFLRYGVMHRNSFVNSPQVLDSSFAIPHTKIRLAGQITGTEGYTEAIASGHLAALNCYCDLSGLKRIDLPKTGALGSLVGYATDPNNMHYQPMHVQFGLFDELEGAPRKKDKRRELMVERAQKDFLAYISSRSDVFSGVCYGA